MGKVANVSATEFPAQGYCKGKTVDVMFWGNFDREFRAKCIRDDAEEPHLTIFQLEEDGRVVLATECVYRFPA